MQKHAKMRKSAEKCAVIYYNTVRYKFSHNAKKHAKKHAKNHVFIKSMEQRWVMGQEAITDNKKA